MQILKDIVDVIPPQSFLLTYSRARARLRFKVRVMVRKNATIRRAKMGGRAARRGAGRAVRRGGWARLTLTLTLNPNRNPDPSPNPNPTSNVLCSVREGAEPGLGGSIPEGYGIGGHGALISAGTGRTKLPCLHELITEAHPRLHSTLLPRYR